MGEPDPADFPHDSRDTWVAARFGGHRLAYSEVARRWWNLFPARRDADGTPAKPSRRASNRGFLPLTLDEYLHLLDWIGPQVRADKRGAIPAHLAPILERLQVSANF